MKVENSFLSLFLGNLSQFLAAFVGTLNVISDGMQYGWSAPVIPILNSAESPVKINADDETWLETIYLLGSLASLPITIYLVDKLGRKYTVLLSTVIGLVAWLLIGSANKVEYLYAGRFLGGLAGDVAFVASPMYVAEIADQRLRGFLSSIIYLMMLVGVLVIYSVAPFVPFYAISVVASIVLGVQLITMPFMPESPYFLLRKGKKEAARKSLMFLRAHEDNEAELQEIALSIKAEDEHRGRPLDLVLVTSNRKALIVIIVLNGAQHFCGITVLMMNVHSILDDAGYVSLDPNISAIIFSMFMLISATISSFVIDKYGRKHLLTSSSVLTGICLLVLAIYFNFKTVGYDLQSISWIPLIFINVYAVFFKFGLGMVPIVMTAELFSSKVKALGMTIGDAVYVLSGYLSIELYQGLSHLGVYVAFYIFAALSFLMAAFSVWYVPETKGKSLEEIQMVLRGEFGVNEKRVNDSV